MVACGRIRLVLASSFPVPYLPPSWVSELPSLHQVYGQTVTGDFPGLITSYALITRLGVCNQLQFLWLQPPQILPETPIPVIFELDSQVITSMLVPARWLVVHFFHLPLLPQDWIKTSQTLNTCHQGRDLDRVKILFEIPCRFSIGMQSFFPGCLSKAHPPTLYPIVR